VSYSRCLTSYRTRLGVKTTNVSQLRRIWKKAGVIVDAILEVTLATMLFCMALICKVYEKLQVGIMDICRRRLFEMLLGSRSGFREGVHQAAYLHV
jgi:hypothetical protein